MKENDVVLLFHLALGLCFWREHRASCSRCGGNNNLALFLGLLTSKAQLLSALTDIIYVPTQNITEIFNCG